MGTRPPMPYLVPLRIILVLFIALVLGAIGPSPRPAVAETSYSLAPAINDPDGLAVDQPTDHVFWDKTVTVQYNGVPICLSSSSSECRPVAPDDAVRIYVDGVLVINEATYTREFGPISFADKLHVGSNLVRIQIIDLQGPRRGGSAFYLVKASGAIQCSLPVHKNYETGTPIVTNIVHHGCCLTTANAWTCAVKLDFCPDLFSFGSDSNGLTLQSPSGSLTINSKGDLTAGSWYVDKSGKLFRGVGMHDAPPPTGPYIALGYDYKIGTTESIGVDVVNEQTIRTIFSPRVPEVVYNFAYRFTTDAAKVALTYYVYQALIASRDATRGMGPSGPLASGAFAALLLVFFNNNIDGAPPPPPQFNMVEGSRSSDLLTAAADAPEPVRAALRTKFGTSADETTLTVLETSRTRVSAYTTFTYTGSGFTPGGEVLVTMGPLDGADTIVELTSADASGRVSGTLEMPEPSKVTLGQNVALAMDYRRMRQGVEDVLNGRTEILSGYGAAQLIDVVADVTPPVTTLSLSGAPGSNGWYISPVAGNTSAEDDLSGVAATFIRVNDGAFVQTTSIALPTEGVHTVDFYSTDKVGNVEPTNRITVRIDWSPPQTRAFVVGPKDVNGVLRDNVVVMFVVFDNVSGKWYTEYAGIDGTGTWRRLYGDQDRFTIDQNGVFQFRYRSVDMAGNQEQDHDSGPLSISRWLVHCTGQDQCIQISGNYNGRLTGDLFSNGTYGITGNLWQTIAGLLRSVNSGSTVSGNIASTIPAIQAGASAVALGPYPVAYYLARATRVYNGSKTFDSINDEVTGVVYVKGDVVFKTIKVRGNVVIIAEGNIYDQSITNAFVSDDPSNGITLYSMKDIRLKSIGSKVVGMVYAPNGSIIIDGPVNFVLRGSLVARTVKIMNTQGFDARYDAAIQSGTFQLPLSSIANPPVSSGPTVTPVQPSATPTSVPASVTPTLAAIPTATNTSPVATTVPSTPTSVPQTATPVSGATATPCSGVQPPTLLGPANGSTVGTLRPALTWQAASGAFYTQLQLSTDPAFSSGVTTYETIMGSYTPPSNLLAHTTYHWRGRSRALIPATYTNCWSPVWTFTTP